MNHLESIKMKIILDELCDGFPEEIKLFIKYKKKLNSIKNLIMNI